MAELTIETLIKLIIGAVVIVAVILGVYFSMTNYVIPFFKGIGFGGEESVIGQEGVCEGKETIGVIRDDYFIWGQSKTHIYFKDGIIKSSIGVFGTTIGMVNGYTIDIYDEYSENKIGGKENSKNVLKYDPAFRIDGAFIDGKEVCKP